MFENPACPFCGQPVPAPDDGSNLLECPHCQTQFFLPTEETETDEADAEAREELERKRTAHQSELDGVRIRRLSDLRRAENRRLSIAVLVAAAGWFWSILIAHHAVAAYRAAGIDNAVIAQSAAALLSLMLGFHFGKKALQIRRDLDADRTKCPPALPDPDFTHLGDGQEHLRGLEKMTSQNDAG